MGDRSHKRLPRSNVASQVNECSGVSGCSSFFDSGSNIPSKKLSETLVLTSSGLTLSLRRTPCHPKYAQENDCRCAHRDRAFHHTLPGKRRISASVRIKIPTLSRTRDKVGAPSLSISRNYRAAPGRTAEGGCPHTNLLHQALVQHRVGYLEEAADVGAVHQVAGRAVFLGRFETVPVDGDHDLV